MEEEDGTAAGIIRNMEGNNKVRVHTAHSHSFGTILATLHTTCIDSIMRVITCDGCLYEGSRGGQC